MSLRATIAAAAAAGALLGTPATAGAASPCAVPDALRGAGLLAEAAAAYERAAPDACATKGIAAIRGERSRRARVLTQSLEDQGVAEGTTVAAARFVRDGREDDIPRSLRAQVAGGDGFKIARALKLATLPDAAGAVVAARLAAAPDAELPDDLRALSGAGLHLAAARALSRAGLDDAAKKELEAALVQDPTLDVPAELRESDRRRPFWREFLGHVGPWVRTIAEIAIGVLLLALVWLLVLRRGRRRIVIEAFTGGPETTGPDTTAALRENYGRLREQHGGKRLNVVTSSGEAVRGAPTAVTDAYPQAALVAGMLELFDRILPSRVRTVTGYLRPRDAVRGAGMTLTFARQHGKVLEEISVWESNYGPIAPATPAQPGYDRLAVPAAAWLLFAAAKRSRFRRVWYPGRKPFEVLGTSDWRSYALFAVGAEAHASDRAGARRMYLAALRRDAANRGAAFNLAVLDLDPEQATADQQTAAVSRLEALRTALEDKGGYDDDPLWYRTLYTLAAHFVDSEPRRAREIAVYLCARLLSKRDSKKRGALHEFLTSVEPMALMTLASALKRDGRNDTPGGTVERETLKEALAKFAVDPDACERFDAEVTHARIAAYVESAHHPLLPDPRYNLACYLARADEDEAVKAQLLETVERGGPGYGHWALKDPALAAFRQRQRAWIDEKLEPLIEAVTPPGAPSSDGDTPRTAIQQLREDAADLVEQAVAGWRQGKAKDDD